MKLLGFENRRKKIENMIIEIDGYFNRTFLSSEKDLSERELREFYEQLKSECVSCVEISELFCNRFNMKKEEELN